MSEKYFKYVVRWNNIITSKEAWVCAESREDAIAHIRKFYPRGGFKLVSIVEDKEGANGKTESPRS